MAGTRKPVSLLIHPSLDGPEMGKLREQGHEIYLQAEASGLGFDLILGPNCWWIPKEHIDLLNTVLKAARETRYPPTEKKPVKRGKKRDNG